MLLYRLLGALCRRFPRLKRRILKNLSIWILRIMPLGQGNRGLGFEQMRQHPLGEIAGPSVVTATTTTTDGNLRY